MLCADVIIITIKSVLATVSSQQRNKKPVAYKSNKITERHMYVIR